MGTEKEVSKSGGGYVGGFFQLFDWTAKSRKKLFSSKSDLAERLKQGKKNDGSVPMTRLHLMDEDEAGAEASIRGGSDYSCDSSVTGDDGYGARAPGVVARLMGLDSLPTSSFSEPNTTPFFDAQSLRDASHYRKHYNYYHDHQIMYSGNLLSKEEGPPRNFVESKPQKVLSRPIEKFQTEILPPKSAKSIPITHHKLLSPIKSPGFIPSKTAADIMQAAAKIIDPSPQAIAKSKMPVVGCSLVTLKVRDLKEKLEVGQRVPLAVSTSASLKVRSVKDKVESANKTSKLAEASRRPVVSNAANYLKGQSFNKSWNGSVDTTSVRDFNEREEGSSGLKNKEKSISLAVQAKVNVQRRGGLGSSSSRALVGQKEQSEVISGQPFKSQSNVQKSWNKKSTTHNASGALRLNNQKQNCLLDKDKLPSKPSVSNLQGRKAPSGAPPAGWHKTAGKTIGSKIGSRKLGLEVTDGERGNSNSSVKNAPSKKRSIDGNLHIEKNQAFDNNQKAIESNPGNDMHFVWAEESKKKDTDVVSFTFTAPLPRSIPASEIPGQVLQRNGGSCMDNPGKRLLLDTDGIKLSSVGYNVMASDALNTLLEQKLNELTKKSSCHKSVKVGSTFSSSVLQDPAPTLIAGAPVRRSRDNKDGNILPEDKLGSSFASNLLATVPADLRLSRMFQGVDEMEECSSNSNDSRKLRRPSPVSVVEPSFSTESSSSLGSTDSCNTDGSKQCSSIQAQEVLSLSSSNKFHYVDTDMELSDSASSASTGTVTRKHAIALTSVALMRSTDWEIEYVNRILCNVELMFQDFALGGAGEIINPHLFDQLERHKGGLENDVHETRLGRKVLFDCVSECLDIRCRRYVGGGYKTWTKGATMVRRKDWLAEEVYKEIWGCRGIGDCMVDELVDKDMSSGYGRWQDFEVDAFALGTEVEEQMFNSLVDEVVADILRS